MTKDEKLSTDAVQREEEASTMLAALGDLLNAASPPSYRTSERVGAHPSASIPPEMAGAPKEPTTDGVGGGTAAAIAEALDATRGALRGLGVLPPLPSSADSSEGEERCRSSVPWQRTAVTSDLFRPPASAPLTTVVPRSGVPPGARVRGRSTVGGNGDGDVEGLVEVWTASLVPGWDDGGGVGGGGDDAARRPVRGDLSSKLTEYTRGTVGARRPFRPGGLTDEDADPAVRGQKSGEDKGDEGREWEGEEEEPAFLSETETRTAREALSMGSRKAWEEGLLLTSPPGMSFEVGLGYDDVFETPGGVGGGKRSSKERGDAREKETGSATVSDIDDGGGTGGEKGAASSGGGGGGDVNAGQSAYVWDKSYFEEDSLFGDSTSGSSESSDDDDSDDADEEKEKDLEAQRKEKEERIKTEEAKNKEERRTDAAAAGGPSLSPEDEVDALLSELHDTVQSPVERAMSSKKGGKSPLDAARLKIREKSDGDDNDPSRKSWAVTETIPLGDGARDFHALLPNPAMTFPFELDDFQKQAVLRLERSECVFLAAHTSAGKTVCAEYAVALARRHCTRAVYTSPIKALSNQKYRDFRTKFGDDVGLITGDMQIGADGSCLIMTTEILRSMLYRGADLIRDIEWVIFDEVHYINDSERGVVWEEVIIMLPDYVNLIFLSATTPNTIEFSDWIGRTKRKPVHVIRTNYRPVPLSHYLWAGRKMHKVMEGKHGFNPKGYSEAARALLPSSARAGAGGTEGRGGGRGGSGGGRQSSSAPQPRHQSSGSRMSSWQQQGSKQDWLSLTKFLEREGLMPTVVFSFSKKKCEEIANSLLSLNLNTASERNLVQSFSIQTVARLSPADASLPQVITTCEMVKRGIGVHHGGLLPILKEMVEILFSRNLIKILFATETFAMGVNMPARCVVFNSIRKHDGVQFRELEPGEYTQMAGRAGRRGLDKVGTVIMCCFGDQPPPQLILKNMLTGSSTKLKSQFRLTYNMILNLLRVEDMSVESMIKRSFSEFATQRALSANDYPKLLARGNKSLSKLDEHFKQDVDSRVGAEDLEEYYFACFDLLSLNRDLLSYILSSGGSTGTGGGALVAGRVLLVSSARKHGYVRAPAIVLRPPTISAKNASETSGGGDLGPAQKIGPAICMVLLPEGFTPKGCGQHLKSSAFKLGDLNYIGQTKTRFFAIYEVQLNEILLVSSIKHKIDSKVFFKEVGPKLTGREKMASLSDPFAGAKSMKSGMENDPFAGMLARGKKGDSLNRSKPAGLSQEAHLVDDAVSYLIEAETMEMKNGVSVLDLKECSKNSHQGSSAMEFHAACDRMEGEIALMRHFRSHYHPNLERHYVTVERKETLRVRVSTLRHLLSNESLQLFPDFLQRKALLQSLGYLDENDTVCLKGRVACEVNTCEELIVTEMVFEGMLNELEPAEIVAALSSLIFQEKSDNELDSELPERLVACCNRMKAIALNLGQMQKDHLLPVDPKDYCESSLKMGLVHVVFEWACGVPFISICELTLVQEGSIVRCITRLDELCREVRNCARVVGNPTLYRKMEAASTAIKRDIVFASSLYVS